MRKNADRLVKNSHWRNDKGTEIEVVDIMDDDRVKVKDSRWGERLMKRDSLLINYNPVGEKTAIEHALPDLKKYPVYQPLMKALTEKAKGKTTGRITIDWTITPELAAALLDHSPRQRSASMHVVDEYARNMKDGARVTSHQGFALSPNFELGEDLRHRCLAVVRSGASITVQITLYLAWDDYEHSRLVWDTARKRTKGNVLELSEAVPRGKGRLVATVLQAWAMIDNAWPRHLTNIDMMAMYELVKVHVDFAAGLDDMTAPVRAAFGIAHSKDPVEVEALAKLVAEKIGYEKGSAAHAMVQLLPKMQKSMNQGPLRHELIKDTLALIYKYIKKQPGVTVVKNNADAYRYFFGADRMREHSSGR